MTKTNLIRLLGLAAAVLGLTTGVPGRAEAASITYTQTTIGSGSLGGTSFTNALITLTQTADTTNVAPTSNGLLAVADLTSTFSVAGVGSGSFTGVTSTYVFQAGSSGGLFNGIVPTNPVILTVLSNSAFSTYNLTTSIGPLSGPGFVNSALSYATSAGSFNISSAGASTFQATTEAVPEPSSLALCGIAGIVGLVVAKGRRNRAMIA